MIDAAQRLYTAEANTRLGEKVPGKLTRDIILKQLSASKGDFRSMGVKRIALFGSFARGDPRKDSDVDVLVEFRKGMKTFDGYMDLKFFLEEMFGRNVDLVLKDAIKPGLKRSILDGAVYAA
jgi:predicted nucleotidyltransferase